MVDALDPAVAQVRRGGYLEAVHHGCLAVTRPDGTAALALGDVGTPFLPRSAIKPLQAVAMVGAGLDVVGAELALVGASHSGEPFHLEAVRSILSGAGLGLDALQNTPALPYDAQARDAWLAGGGVAETLTQNCSGKHAGMLRTCVRAGWSIREYRDPTHPLQAGARRLLGEFAGETIGEPVVDGCGAPAFAVTVTGLARAFGRVAAATDGPARAVADAFRDHPEYASGTRRDELVFHREVPGLICKLGAEGTLAAGLADGTGIVIKISDGAYRAAVPVLVAVLTALGHGTAALTALDPFPVLGHGAVVGNTETTPELDAALAVLRV